MAAKCASPIFPLTLAALSLSSCAVPRHPHSPKTPSTHSISLGNCRTMHIVAVEDTNPRLYPQNLAHLVQQFPDEEFEAITPDASDANSITVVLNRCSFERDKTRLLRLLSQPH
jgi:hypothetical protein